jgi:hypothetical protein
MHYLVTHGTRYCYTGYMTRTPDLDATITRLSHDVRAAEATLAEARERRDIQIRKAVRQDGRTMYAVAKLAGLTQGGIRKIMAR